MLFIVSFVLFGNREPIGLVFSPIILHCEGFVEVELQLLHVIAYVLLFHHRSHCSKIEENKTCLPFFSMKVPVAFTYNDDHVLPYLVGRKRDGTEFHFWFTGMANLLRNYTPDRVYQVHHHVLVSMVVPQATGRRCGDRPLLYAAYV